MTTKHDDASTGKKHAPHMAADTHIHAPAAAHHDADAVAWDVKYDLPERFFQAHKADLMALAQKAHDAKKEQRTEFAFELAGSGTNAYVTVIAASKGKVVQLSSPHPELIHSWLPHFRD